MKTRKRDMSLFAAHGAAQDPTPEYKSWRHMMARCFQVTAKQYPLYGGAGITVCDGWRSFPVFLADMGPKPTPSHTIERNDNAKGYGPGNCRWATRAEQNRNKTDTIVVTFRGAQMCLAEAARAAGISYATVCGRVRMGWPMEQILGLAPSRRARTSRPEALARP